MRMKKEEFVETLHQLDRCSAMLATIEKAMGINIAESTIFEPVLAYNELFMKMIDADKRITDIVDIFCWNFDFGRAIDPQSELYDRFPKNVTNAEELYDALLLIV